MPRSSAFRLVVLVVLPFAAAALGCAARPTPPPEEPTVTVRDADTSASRRAEKETLRTCCVALAKAADALTPPKAMYAGAAADRCKQDVESVQTERDQDHLVATIRGELRGTPMPKECD